MSKYPRSVYLPPMLATECEYLEGGDEVEYVRVDEIERIRGLLWDVAYSGVEFEDERVNYVSVQIGRDTWLEIRREVKGE